MTDGDPVETDAGSGDRTGPGPDAGSAGPIEGDPDVGRGTTNDAGDPGDRPGATGSADGTGWPPDGTLDRVRAAIGGPHTIGETRGFWAGVGLLLVYALAYPYLTNPYDVLTYTVFYIWVLLALSLCVVWGYTGIFSFGQTAFFGVGGYVYGVVGTNLVDATGATNLALVAAVVVPALVAAVLGYFMFYGRVGGVFVGIITFAVTLIMGLLLGRSSGTTIGSASLGGSNGMTAIPTMVLGYGPATVRLDRFAMYYFALGTLVVAYLGLRYVLNGSAGYAMVATRENEDRTEMFGYDVRWVKVKVFTAGAGFAGFAGALYAAQGNFVGPGIMGLTAAILPVIWITVGGRQTLVGTIAGAFGLQYASQRISLVGSEYSLIMLGGIVIVAILFFPAGVVPNLHRAIRDREIPGAGALARRVRDFRGDR